MANILDIRRRIRSVINTRQITKAMKVVSAAKLRRAQERALAARPYAQMLTNVLKSLVARAEIYDPETGEPKHPLLAQREEKNILLIVVTGDKGSGGRVQREHYESGYAVPGVQGGKEHRYRGHRPQGPRLSAPALSGGEGADAEPGGSCGIARCRVRGGGARRRDSDHRRACRHSGQSGVRAGVRAGGERD